jgi:hypothetical protein
VRELLLSTNEARKRAAIGGEVAHEGRGAAGRRQCREAAGVVASKLITGPVIRLIWNVGLDHSGLMPSVAERYRLAQAAKITRQLEEVVSVGNARSIKKKRKPQKPQK